MDVESPFMCETVYEERDYLSEMGEKDK